MAFSSAAVPGPALVSAALKKPADELRAFAAGIIAHVIIQTFYRLEHPGNYIITERSIWVGDSKASTISKVLDNLDGLRGLVKSALKSTSKPKPNVTGNATTDLLVALTYLIDQATDESAAGKFVRKRYDIVDFGPIVISPISKGRYGEAYEIKSEGGVKEGKNYIAKQVGKYNKALSDLATTLGGALNISGLESYQLRPGQSWPYETEILIVGPNILSFWREASGLIVYRWLNFKQLSWRKLWEFVKKAEADIRKAFETRSPLKPELLLELILVTVATVFIIGVCACALGGTGALGLGEAGARLARLAQTGALANRLSAASASAAIPQESRDDSAAVTSDPQADKVNEVLAAIEKMDDLDPSFLSQINSRPPAPTNDGLSGGTPQTPYEQALYNMVDRLVNAIVFLYSVQVGQGDESLSEDNLALLKENLAVWIGSFVSAYGLENLLALTGQNKSADLDDETALKIAEVIVAAVRGNLENTQYGRFIANFFSLSSEDIEASLPLDSSPDGE